MKTKPALLMAVLFITAFSTTTSFAQSLNLDESSGCLVTNVTGKVTYQEKGSPAPKTVTSGSVIPDDATVVFGKKANMTLACDDRSLVVTKKGTHQMETLSKEVQSKGEVSRFAAMAFKAKGYVTPPDTTKKKGWGDKDSLIFHFPFSGKIALQPTKFSWTSLKAGTTYKLIIYENSKDAPLLSVTTSGAAFNFDPGQLAVKTGKVYHVQVMLANDSKTASKVVNITFSSSSDVDTVLSSLMKDKEYLKSNPAQKSIMEASELESKEFYSLASERYQKAIKTDANNALARQMYSAFMDRMSK